MVTAFAIVTGPADKALKLAGIVKLVDNVAGFIEKP
jgi:hypothetical protein